MKRLFALLLLLVATGALATDATERPLSPDWTLTDRHGKAVSFPEVGQPTTVVLFWASWCPYCRNLMPHLQSLVDEYGDQVRVLAINVFEDELATAESYLDERGYQFILLPDGDEVAAEYGVRGTPGLFLVNSEGRIVWDLSDAHAEAERLAGISENWQKATRLAPFWAAELRRAIDSETGLQAETGE